jgi:hypothetical protein
MKLVNVSLKPTHLYSNSLYENKDMEATRNTWPVVGLKTNQLEGLGFDDSMILKWILKNQDITVYIT